VRGVIFGASRTSYLFFQPTDHAQKPYKCQTTLNSRFGMALRLGVGDVFTVCKGAVDFCRAIHDEPEEVQSVIAEMKLIREHLKSLESQIGDEKSFATARPDM
jgi:hypothetical protein